MDHSLIFTSIYENCVWGNNNDLNYKGSSGDGSSLKYNADCYIPFLKKFIKNNKIKKIIDLGCGDFICGTNIYDDIDNIQYFG